jgi:hypothetical protein
MFDQIEKVMQGFFPEHLCKLASMATIQEILQHLRPLLDVSDEQIERADSELFVQVRRLLHNLLSSYETFFVNQIGGVRPGDKDHIPLSEELARIQLALSICYI